MAYTGAAQTLSFVGQCCTSVWVFGKDLTTSNRISRLASSVDHGLEVNACTVHENSGHNLAHPPRISSPHHLLPFWGK